MTPNTAVSRCQSASTPASTASPYARRASGRRPARGAPVPRGRAEGAVDTASVGVSAFMIGSIIGVARSAVKAPGLVISPMGDRIGAANTPIVQARTVRAHDLPNRQSWRLDGG